MQKSDLTRGALGRTDEHLVRTLLDMRDNDMDEGIRKAADFALEELYALVITP